MRKKPLVIYGGVRKELQPGDTIHYYQEDTPSDPKDGEVWIHPNKQSTGVIIRQKTPPLNPVIGQLWLDESHQVADYSSYKDLTDYTSGYGLRRGEAVIVMLNAVTSKALNIITDPFTGLYELKLVITENLNGTNDAGIDLYPNNTTVTPGSIELALYELGPDYNIAAGSTATNGTKSGLWMGSYVDGSGGNVFGLIWGMRGMTNCLISTTTKLKHLMSQRTDIRSAKWFCANFQSFWNDTTTVWSSLGTITSAYPMTGYCVIKRVM